MTNPCWIAIAKLDKYGDRNGDWDSIAVISDEAKAQNPIVVTYPYDDHGIKNTFMIHIEGDGIKSFDDKIVIKSISNTKTVDYSNYDYSNSKGKFYIDEGICKFMFTHYDFPKFSDGTELNISSLSFDVFTYYDSDIYRQNTNYLASGGADGKVSSGICGIFESWQKDQIEEWEKFDDKENQVIGVQARYVFPPESSDFSEERTVQYWSNYYTYDEVSHVKTAANGVALNFNAGESKDNVKTDFTLPSTAEDCSITWKSSDENVIRIKSGVAVVYPDDITDKNVTLTCVVKKGNISFAKNFDPKVKTSDYIFNQIEMSASENILQSNVWYDRNYYDVSWSLKEVSSSTLNFNNNLWTFVPQNIPEDDDDYTETLTASVKIGNETYTKDILVTYPTRLTSDLENAAYYITNSFNSYFLGEGDSITLPNTSLFNDIILISWTTSDPSVIDANGNIKQPTTESRNVKLTATISKGTASGKKESNLTLPAVEKFENSYYYAKYDFDYSNNYMTVSMYKDNSSTQPLLIKKYKILNKNKAEKIITLKLVQIANPKYGINSLVSPSTYSSQLDTWFNTNIKSVLESLLSENKKNSTTVQDVFKYYCVLAGEYNADYSVDYVDFYRGFVSSVYGDEIDNETAFESLTPEQRYEGMVLYTKTGLEYYGVMTYEEFFEVYKSSLFSTVSYSDESINYTYTIYPGNSYLDILAAYDMNKTWNKQYGSYRYSSSNSETNVVYNNIAISITDNILRLNYNIETTRTNYSGSFTETSTNHFVSKASSFSDTEWVITDIDTSVNPPVLKMYEASNSSKVYELKFNGHRIYD